MNDLYKTMAVEKMVLGQYAARNPRKVIVVDGPKGGGVLVTLDEGTQYYLGLVDNLLAGNFPECKKED